MEADRLYAISKAIADPTRFEILKRIAACEEVACSVLNELFPVTQATISHHLRELHEAGLIEVRRQAKYMHIKLQRAVWDEYVHALAAVLPDSFETR
jgi:ArsR family transcriptional regulator, arsenate/arsenite/antimonite-responsive transcriptional repressor